MKDVFVIGDNLLTPLGATTAGNFEQLKNGATGVKVYNDAGISAQTFAASMFPADAYADNQQYTKFEQLLIASISDALNHTGIDPKRTDTILILSSTKGNITLLQDGDYSPERLKRASLHHSAALIKAHFGFVHQPIFISSACISGLSAILTGARLINAGRYKNAVVAGADVVSRFVVTGFQSFQALSAAQCRPFDRDRTGINLGEGAATVILSAESKSTTDIKVAGGSLSDDANHISGPSRTGEELGTAIKQALQEAVLQPGDIDMISAHGTATVFNDEMEASAINYAGLADVPLNSLKGYYGHTLGAAGLVEAVISMQSMQQGIIIPTPGFSNLGTKPVNVASQLLYQPVNRVLKTASGFGGCNAALIFTKQ
ncbi:3-oxoacyl-[acyl-carrier-protein] synthase-1 [Mucilaginibacter yixingensis]|uniref:3-oxoacyl-[acyl-carrier-protein] synthase-1 n=1 Tax=Mucilaginibacter yixingensis TaxID=1295612 RepID=A0A2T5JD35_9SPHI|nr:beta-ketoacyl synthase N-terminal-like domain-containing protein [Mucilaginibacter yixingensis]PTQ99670.1 3-oxoacyl-[acyl-carrier-protein] synthase-1 [Mucilaginibacter yixingensis]